MRRVLLLAGSMFLAVASQALACTGQNGKPIYSDNFADETGGWDLSTTDAIKNSSLVIGLTQTDPPTSIATADFQSTYNPVDGDYCTTFTIPQVSKGTVFIGMEILGHTYSDYFYFYVTNQKDVDFARFSDNKWSTVISIANSPLVKTGPDDVNSLRVIVKDAKLTFFVNDTQVKVVRVQMPAGNMHFGVRVGLSADVPPGSYPTSFKSFAINEAP